MKRTGYLCLSVLLSLQALDASAQPRLHDALTAADLAGLPIFFEPNKGQAEKEAAFVARGARYTLLLENGKVKLNPARATVLQTPDESNPSVVLEFVGARQDAQYLPATKLPGKSNYYLGKNPASWLTGIPQFAQVRLPDLYRGIDLSCYGTRGELEYDFVVAPGADPNSILMEVTGADNIQIDSAGNLQLQTSTHQLLLHKPSIYQMTSNGRRRIEGNYILRARSEVAFSVADYDANRPLIIDPVLTYSTLIGANNGVQPEGIAVDQSGNVYIAGTTWATNYPVVHAFQPQNNGNTDVFITKLGPGGNTILYSTYLGGSGFDNAAAIAVDPAGSAYVTGTVGSSDFPTTPGAFMTTCPGFCNTPFLSKFLTDGTLAFSTFMGGSNSPAHAIAVDSAGEAYIAGVTASDDLPTTPGSFEPVYPGMMCTSCYNGYVEKLNASGTALVYSTYFGAVSPTGSTPSTVGAGIAVDGSGSAYLVGNTAAIPLMNPIQSSVIGAPTAFVARFAPDGGSLIFSTYIGGGGDFATGAAVDSTGNVHVVGTSSSCEFPLLLNALSTDCADSGDQKIFALALNSTGRQILFSTFLQSGYDPSIGIDSKGNSFVAGTTTSSHYPLLYPIESTPQYSNAIGFVTALDPNGKLLFSTYLGATAGGSAPSGIAVDSKDGVYITGWAQGDFPLLRPIPSQTFQSTNYTMFVSKISPTSVPQFTLSPRKSPILTLRNVSTAPLTISSILPSPNFTMEGNCGSGIPAAGECTLILLGAKDGKTQGTVTITSDAYLNPQTFAIQKSANGDTLGYAFSIYPARIQFPPQLIGTTSASQQVVLQNSGTPAVITSISVGPPFSQTNNCPALLPTAASCTIAVRYSAATVQDYGQLSVVHDQMQDTVSLDGSGSSSAITPSTSFVEFGSQFASGPTVGRIVNLVNTTPVPATITGLAASAGYTETDTCSVPLAAHGECRVLLSFLPNGNQDAPGTLTVSNYGPGGPESVTLHGTGIQPGDLGFSPTSLSLVGDVGISNGYYPATLTNNSQKMTSIQQISTTGPFSQTNTCPHMLLPAASCQISVSFQPTVIGPANGTLQVMYLGTGSPQTIPLTGTASTIVQFSPNSLQFGQQLVGTSVQSSIFLDNGGAITVNLSAFTIQGSEFSIVSNGCGQSLPRNTGCGLSILFTPSGTGVRTGTLSVTASDYSQPHTATLQGIGISGGQGSLSVNSLSFPPQKVGTQSQPQEVSFTNSGTGSLKIISIASAPQFFTESNNCATSLSPGATCVISIVFAPSLRGVLAGSLLVQDDGSDGQHLVTLTGTGQ
jgi:hypothetical protein